MKKEIKRRSDCPVSFALDIFGDKWTLIILRDLLIKGKKTFGEFLSSKEKIATNILADRLNTLEKSGIITGSPAPDKKSKINYTLTEKGIDLLPVLIEIIKWSAKYDSNTSTSAEFLARIYSEKEVLIEEITSKLKAY